MKKTPRILVASAGALALLVACWSAANLRASRLAERAWQQKIESNVPPRSEFDRLLGRDLASFFRQSSGQSVTVEPTLLSREPTPGKDLPEFFVWVRLLQGKNLVGEGVATVCGSGRSRFLPTGFVSKKQMLRSAPGAGSFSPEIRNALAKYLR